MLPSLRQNPWFWLGLVVLALFVAVGVVSAVRLRSVVVSSRPPEASPGIVSPSPSPPPDPNRDRSFLVLGYGGGAHAGGRLTDTMILVVVQPKLQRVMMISLPRDTWVQLPLKVDGNLGSKLNSAYSYGLDNRQYLDRPRQFTGPAGGGQLAKFAVKEVTGIEPEYFVAVDFSGFTKIIDQLGGVDVKVQRPFIDEWYPIEGKEDDTCEKTPEELAAIATLSGTKAEQSFPCRYEKLEFTAGEHHLAGETALKYVRSRHSNQDGGDLGRAARQRAVLEALRNQVFSLQAIPRLPSIVNTLAGHITLDIPVGEWDDWLGKAQTMEDYTIEGIVIDDKTHLKAAKSSDGQFILVPKAGEGNWTEIHDWIKTQLSGI